MFLTRNALEDRSPWGDFWFEPITMRTMTGLRVGADGAMTLSAVWRGLHLISGHMAMLPLYAKKRHQLARIKEHWLYDLFRRPNPLQRGFEWRQMLQAHLLLRGNAYCEIFDNSRGEVTALVPMHPDRVKVEMLPSGDDYRYRVTDWRGEERILARGQVWHLRGLSNNGIVGLSVIEVARESLGLGIAAQAYGARFYANDAKPVGGWIEHPGNFADKTARQLFREAVQEAQSSANRGKMMVLDRGMKYHEVGLTNADAQFLETRKFQISEVARWLGVPPHKLGDLERSTNNNIEQQSLEYISDGLLYWITLWESAIEGDLLLDSAKEEVELDVRILLRGDSTARANYNQKGIFSGYLTRNEARADDGREPLDGLDEPLQPVNMMEVGDDAAAKQQQNKRAPAQQQNDATDARRAVALLENAAGRMARRYMKKQSVDANDAPLLAEVLAIPIAAARGWCAADHNGKDEDALIASLMSLGSQP